MGYVPKAAETRRVWLNKLRPNWDKTTQKDLSSNLRVCYTHFPPGVVTKGKYFKFELTALPYSQEEEAGARRIIEEAKQMERIALGIHDSERSRRVQQRQDSALDWRKRTAELEETVSSDRKRIRLINDDKNSLEEQNAELQDEVSRLRQELASKSGWLPRITFESVTSSDELSRFYTGISTAERLKGIMNLCIAYGLDRMYYQGSNKSKRGRKKIIDFPNALLLALVKLRQDFPFVHMAYLFDVSKTTASKTFHGMVTLLVAMMQDVNQRHWMPTEENVGADAFECFKEHYPELALILDCTELFTEVSSNHELQKVTWSMYKHGNTVKVLVGITTAGKVVFVSRCYPGRMSDRMAVEVSGVMDALWDGAQVMADKGFLIEEMLAEHGLKLVVPPVLHKDQTFTAEELRTTKNVAAVRIHVERAIRRAKIYKYISNTVSITRIANMDGPVQLAFLLGNFMSPLVKGNHTQDE